MALIKCPDCGKNISDQSEYCLNCGRPTIVKKNYKVSDSINDGRNVTGLILGIIALILSIVDWITFTSINDPYGIVLVVCPFVLSLIGFILSINSRNDNKMISVIINAIPLLISGGVIIFTIFEDLLYIDLF